FILQDEIPHVTMPLCRQCYQSQEELPGMNYQDGGFEVTPANPGVRRFIYEHLQDVLRVVWKVMKFGGTFSGPKAVICAPEAVILSATYAPTKDEQPLPDRVQKIVDWPIPRDLSDVRGFLGTLG
ncbi:hypothetical protein FA13DRAFT_1585610, partial [Coprinellus micaceus]